MYQYASPDPRVALFELIEEVYNHGDVVSPRDQKTFELRHVTMRIEHPENCLPVDMGRAFNPRLAAAETLQLLGGIADPEWMTAASPDYLKFTGGAMTGAYGPRLGDQMQHVISALRTDRDTRQAVATIWDPGRDLLVKHGDRPCTVYVSFMIRRGKLITSTYMRSQDVFLGLTYDMVMFSQLHWTMSNILGVDPGDHIHTVQSLHLYERDIERALMVTHPTEAKISLRGLGEMGDNWCDVQTLARSIAYRRGIFDGATETETWLRQNSEVARGLR